MTDDLARLETVWLVVIHIPPGHLASYGEVARRAGMPGKARFVGYALSKLPEDTRVPWHRVINAQRHLSFPVESAAYHNQKARLLSEGVTFKGLKAYPVNSDVPETATHPIVPR